MTYINILQIFLILNLKTTIITQRSNASKHHHRCVCKAQGMRSFIVINYKI